MLQVFSESKRNYLQEVVTVVGREWDSIQGRRKVIAVRSMAGHDMAIVQTGDGRVGHDLIPVDSLEKEIAFEIKQYQSKQKMTIAAKAQADAQAKAHHTITSLDGFEDTLTPKMRGVAVRALTKKGISSEGVYYKSIRDLIRDHVKRGWTVKGTGSSRRFTGPRKGFLSQKDLTKVGMDYAAYLSKSR